MDRGTPEKIETEQSKDTATPPNTIVAANYTKINETILSSVTADNKTTIPSNFTGTLNLTIPKLIQGVGALAGTANNVTTGANEGNTQVLEPNNLGVTVECSCNQTSVISGSPSHYLQELQK
jgi:hypothetical protein